MPAASVCDSISVALQCSFESTKSKDDSTVNLTGSSSRILQSEVEYEESEDYRSIMLDHLKSKYLVLNPPNAENSDARKVPENSANNHTKKESAKLGLPEPAVILYAANKVHLGWKNDFPAGAGMYNVGNTCYLNSTLQALFHVPALVNWLLSDPHHKNKCEQNGGGGECLTCAMAKTLQFSHQKSNEAIKPFYIYNKLKQICRTMVPGQQEDAHEFLRYLLEGMEKAYLARHKAMKLDNYSKETTPISQIFGGYLRTEVKCLQCRHVSTTFQHFQDLLVDIRKASTLDEALTNYFSQEQLDNNDYKCEACKRRVPATKQFSLEKPPKVLCVQLKRFSVLGGKIQRLIGYKPTIDMGPYLWNETGGPRKKLTYKLMSMVTHMGSSVNCGHYTAVAQVSSGKYYSFDDSCVRQINFNNFINTNAYIMIFELESQSNNQFQSHSPKVNGAVASKSLMSFNNSPIIKRIAPKMLSSPTVSKSKEGTSPVKDPLRFIGPLLPSSMKVSNSENGKTLNGSSSLVPYDGSSEEEETNGTIIPETPSKIAQSNDVNSAAVKEDSRLLSPKDNSKVAKISNGNGVHWDKLDSSSSSSNGAMINGNSEPRTNGFYEDRKPIETDGKERWKSKVGHEDRIVTKASSCRNDPVIASTANGWSVSENKDDSRKSNNHATAIHAAAARPFDGTNRSETADRLTKLSHRGYGNPSVTSWEGNKPYVEREVENERHQDRKRPNSDDEEIDKGRTKKAKTHHDRSYERPYYKPNNNLFQDYQNKNHNRNNHRYFNPYRGQYKSNFNQRNRNNNYRRFHQKPNWQHHR